MVSKAEPKKASIPPAAVVIALLVALGLGGFFYLDRASKKEPPPPSPLTPEARAYAKDLHLSNVDMKAHESYLKQSVVEITGNIQNTGQRTLKLVEIKCVFYDAYGQEVLRKRVAIVSSNLGMVPPTETRPFRLAFDDVPEAWNQTLPQLVIANIQFQ